ncbi:sigma-70 family RNA polymerase sigma factor [candidate division KSB1 bacterium]|nr:sigma-70 family RNA polymerase sigma factor [candidate division KSB1 bacterium]
MESTDTNLIERALAGDQQAYAELVNRYRGPVYNLLLRMVKNKEEAEDLVQEAFIKAFHSLASFNAQFAFSTWLYKIAINNCIDHFRKQKLKLCSIDKPVPSKEGEIKREFPDISLAADRELLDSEKTVMIQEAIDSLPEKYRLSIVYRHQDEKSYEEIADLMEIPLGTVKARIFRAREMLKKKLKDQLMP